MFFLKMDHDGQQPGKRAFFKSTKSKFPMYPHHEEKIRWDDYGNFFILFLLSYVKFQITMSNLFQNEGEIIKPEDWIDTSVVGNQGEQNDDDIIDADGAQDMSEVPTKCVQQNLNLNIKAQIQFIDFEGRSDGESVMKLIQQVLN